MKIEKSQYQSAIITAIVSLLILLILFLCGMKAQRNEMDEGVMVSFGDMDDGFGEQAPQEVEENVSPQEAVTPTVTPQPKPTVSQEKVMTQEDPSVVLERERKRKAEEAERVRKEEEAKRAKAASVVRGALGNTGGGQGEGSGDGKKGNPVGKGSDGGNSWSLAGRSLKGRLAQPSYQGNEQGVIVVAIRVDINGKVVDASIGTGTTITSESMRNAALAAAKKNVFTTGNSPAVGTIIYKFTLN